jgi:glycosyltransferase involved in cell wall biosynthesis
MTRLAVFTPLPPSASGIGQYSAELLPFLGRDLDVYLADDAPEPVAPPAGVMPRRVAEWSARRDGYDTIIYQVGNNPDHAYALAQAETTPGILVLHDVVLQHLQVWRALHEGPPAAARYRAEMARRYGAVGDRAAAALLANQTPDQPLAAFPLCETAVEQSRAVIVHNRFASELLRRYCPDAPVTVVPHGVPLLPPGNRAAARAALGLPQDALVVAAVGALIPEKRLEVALGAFARALFGLREAVFVIAGAGSRHYDPAGFIAAQGLAPVVRQLGWVDAAIFERVLVAADLCVNLRWPTGGETSGSLLRMLAAGRATIVSAAGSFTETPDDACITVPVGAGEEDALACAMLHAAREPGWADRIGAAGRAFVAREHSLDCAARGYQDVIAQVVGANTEDGRA